MDIEKGNQNWEIWGVAIVVSLAVLIGLFFKGVTGESVSDAVKDIGAALIPILAAFVAARLVTREMDPAERFLRAGESSLDSIKKKHPDILSGPKASRENYDPENPGKVGRYLFFQKKGQKAQFVPVLPFREGIVEIRVPMTALLQMGYEREGLEEIQKGILKKVNNEVENRLKRFFPDTYEILEHKHKDIAIAVDFSELKLGPRKFAKVVTCCVEAALDALDDLTP